MGLKSARLAMVESQIRPNGVRDPRILNAFATLPRELFVPEKLRPLAYMDDALLVSPALAGSIARYMLPPMVLARMLEFASLCPGDHALDIGGTTGYSAAISSELCGKVDAVEDEVFAASMRHHLESAGIAGVSVHAGDLKTGLESRKPYDVILLNGAAAGEPKQLFDQLAEGGRLVVILRSGWLGRAYLYTKSAGSLSGRAIFDAGAEYLPGFEPQPQFVF